MVPAMLLSCHSEIENSEDNHIQLTTEEESQEISTPHVKEDSKLTVENLIVALDSIYNIEKSEFFTLTQINFNKEERIFALALNQEELSEVNRYGVFTILKYKSQVNSRIAFKELALLVSPIGSGEVDSIFKLKTTEGFNLFYDVLAKSGSILILKDQFIIHKFRRCNDNYIENEKKEDELLNYLYSGDFPSRYYFIRHCCSCPMDKGIVVR